MQRLSGTPKRPVVQALAELSSDANRILAFLQMHGISPLLSTSCMTSQNPGCTTLAEAASTQEV